jgi:uroporphyrinogen decarboxylase
MRVLEAAAEAVVRLLHLHGQNIMFEALSDYPVDIINWHDRRTAPTLAEARSWFAGCLAGGLNEWDTLGSGTREQISGEIRDAIGQTRGIHHIVTGGCVIPIDVPDDRLRAAREAAAGSSL